MVVHHESYGVHLHEHQADGEHDEQRDVEVPHGPGAHDLADLGDVAQEHYAAAQYLQDVEESHIAPFDRRLVSGVSLAEDSGP